MKANAEEAAIAKWSAIAEATFSKLKGVVRRQKAKTGGTKAGERVAMSTRERGGRTSRIFYIGRCGEKLYGAYYGANLCGESKHIALLLRDWKMRALAHLGSLTKGQEKGSHWKRKAALNYLWKKGDAIEYQ